MVWIRLEWGPRAVDMFEAWADIVVVVDLVLASPNGAALTAALASSGPVVVAGCLRNATTVGAYAARVACQGVSCDPGATAPTLLARPRWTAVDPSPC